MRWLTIVVLFLNLVGNAAALGKEGDDLHDLVWIVMVLLMVADGAALYWVIAHG